MEELTLERLAARLAEVEQSNVRLQHSNEQLTNEVKLLRLAQRAPSEATADPQQQASRQSKHATPGNANSPRKSRRTLLRQGLGVAAAVVGVGALAEMSTDQALAGGHPHHHVGPNDNLGIFSSSDGTHPAVSATGTNGSIGVDATSDSGTGVVGSSTSSYGVTGYSYSGTGVTGQSGTSGFGVLGNSTSGAGVYGYSYSGGSSIGVGGDGYSYGVYGISNRYGVYGTTKNGDGTGVYGDANRGDGNGTGVYGISINGDGVHGDSVGGTGVTGTSSGTNGIGVNAQSQFGIGVKAFSVGGEAIFAQSTNNHSIHAISTAPGKAAVLADGGSSGYGVYASSPSGISLYANNGSHVEEVNGNSTKNHTIYPMSGGGPFAVYAISSGGTALGVNGTILVQGNAAGQVTLPKGKNSMTFTNTAATTSSNIMLNPQSKYTGKVVPALWVVPAAGSFTLYISAVQTNDVVFNYLIIN